MLEFGNPTTPGWKQFYRWYSSAVLPRIGAAISGDRVAYAYLPVAVGPGERVGVEIFGALVAAEVADDVQYDPDNERVRT